MDVSLVILYDNSHLFCWVSQYIIDDQRNQGVMSWWIIELLSRYKVIMSYVIMNY